MNTSVTTYGNPYLLHTQSRCTRCVSNDQVKPRAHVYMYRHSNCCAESCFHSMIIALKIKFFYEVNQYSVHMYFNFIVVFCFDRALLILPMEYKTLFQCYFSVNIVINLKYWYDPPWLNNYLLWGYESFPQLEQFCHNFNYCNIRICETNYWCDMDIEIKL